jgi:quinol monooxygenase YgiN
MLRLLAIAALAMIALTVTSPGRSTALAQDAKFYTATYIEVGPLLAKVGAAALRADRNTGRKNPGNLHLDVFENLDRPNQFVILGAWTDQAAYDTYASSEHFKALSDKLQSMLVAPMDTRTHVAIAGSVAVAPDKSSRDAVVAITHVDVVPPEKDNAVAALKKLAEDSRQHPGNLQFHIWQQTNRPNHFTVIEAWSSRGAFNIHQMRNETREFRSKLASMTGALYDERLFRPFK